MKMCLALFLSAMTIFFMLALPRLALAEIEGNCLMCHKYAGLGRIEKSNGGEEEGKTRVFYINNKIFETTYHGKIPCKSCHIGVDKIPHTDAPKIDCATDCHIVDPSVNKPFSHKKIVTNFAESTHGEEGSRSEDKSGLPVCKDCHSNKPYHAGLDEQHKVGIFLEVCIECHQSKAFVERFYEHMIYRTIKRRSSRDVVRLCSTCHADQALMEKAGLDVVVGFSSTFHAKAIAYGNEDVANCLNCHAPYQLGYSPHRITSRRDKSSPVNPENKIKTCRQSGCHIQANEEFATGGRVHASPEEIKLLARMDTDLIEDELVVDTARQAKVVGWIQLFYKVLIIVVVGGLGLHHLLGLFSSRRERRIRSG